MSPLLYQLSYPGLKEVSPDGFEPSTPSLKVMCSTKLSYGLTQSFDRGSNRVDLALLVLERFVDLLDELVGNLLDFFLCCVGNIFGEDF